MSATPRSNRLTDLGELQLKVLEALSELGEGTVYDVLAHFPEAERPRYTTLLTVLRGLEKKGLAEHRARDRQFVFRAVVDLAEVKRGVVQDLLTRVFGGSPRDLVATLFDAEAVTPEIARELKALVDERQGGKQGDRARGQLPRRS